MTTTRFFPPLATALLAVLLTGCGNTAYFEPAVPATDESIVYLYRPAASNPGKKPLRTSYPEILVDGEGVGFLHYGQRLELSLPPGRHTFVATGLTPEARWKPEDREYTLQVEPGEVHYLRLRVEFDTDHMTIGSFRDQYLIHLHPVESDIARYQIRETRAAD
ncbi:hypothetical protein F0M18_14360 [Pseudohalioglobus sediminis]|uniref:DUF2846 domain-containing protein n=1 Tax=Pseudohalioglobus sediminis TaxID=2606449 RepID=A0A5B0WRN0_9GAMM|nr:hypothetical protein [Pseudohalioglobus sediminis]KAA1189536.1 hypothetical protein F0M18_14360 [Pseudohalioglobus sediminis]